MSSKEQIWMGFDIKLDSGLKPVKLQFWKPEKFKLHSPQKSLKFHSDALTGLGALCLNPYHKLSIDHWSSWLSLEPHLDLYLRSQTRVQALKNQFKTNDKDILEYFERNFSEILNTSQHHWGIDLTHFNYIVDSIDYLETRLESPLLYNFQVQFSKKTIEKLQILHSFLYNLRALIAYDYNSHVKDPTFESVKVDSISDYLSKAEYVANDAMLYYQFKKRQKQLSPELSKEFENTYVKYCHNGYCLIENLPASFLKALNSVELEETLYIVQMDWLLGTEAGLLFRIREEIFGLLDGYDKIFWPECQNISEIHPTTLEVNCKVSYQHSDDSKHFDSINKNNSKGFNSKKSA